jgi:hypothetical protein
MRYLAAVLLLAACASPSEPVVDMTGEWGIEGAHSHAACAFYALAQLQGSQADVRGSAVLETSDGARRNVNVAGDSRRITVGELNLAVTGRTDMTARGTYACDQRSGEWSMVRYPSR